MLNLFVEFGFQMFNMKTLFYFKLRIHVCAGMIDNLKTRNIALILTPFRSTEVFKNVGIFVLKEMLINEHTCLYMCFSPLFSDVYSKRMEILFYSVSFCPLKSKINSFLRIQFSPLLSRCKGKNIISCFLTSYTNQVEFFLLIFF